MPRHLAVGAGILRPGVPGDRGRDRGDIAGVRVRLDRSLSSIHAHLTGAHVAGRSHPLLAAHISGMIAAALRQRPSGVEARHQDGRQDQGQNGRFALIYLQGKFLMFSHVTGSPIRII